MVCVQENKMCVSSSLSPQITDNLRVKKSSFQLHCCVTGWNQTWVLHWAIALFVFQIKIWNTWWIFYKFLRIMNHIINTWTWMFHVSSLVLGWFSNSLEHFSGSLEQHDFCPLLAFYCIECISLILSNFFLFFSSVNFIIFLQSKQMSKCQLKGTVLKTHRQVASNWEEVNTSRLLWGQPETCPKSLFYRVRLIMSPNASLFLTMLRWKLRDYHRHNCQK